ncbi:MAG: HAMP domain-containing histidine kinase [Lachnospiraceae bacterium]|nr:HAMP domain-containing histidine kinase [Lachnospiraceae bacterium]
MNQKRNSRLIMLLVLSVSLIATALAVVFLTYYFSHIQYQTLADFCEKIIEEYPECRYTISEALKSQETDKLILSDENILLSFGYEQLDFMRANAEVFWVAGTGFQIGGVLFLLAFLYWHRKSEARIKMLTNYLEKINTGGQSLLLDTSEDEFSRLQDEIYKTITTLYQTRDAALMAKRNFADNLSNIAHQLKTPITAISLSVQMMKQQLPPAYLAQIERQLYRLTHLAEALLLLSRIDAGTLTMKESPVDVFTILTLAYDNLQELFVKEGVFVDIPETDEISIKADLEWTMEAIMNLLKNCMEHTPSGTTVHCSYEKNPLYVQVRIWDEGQGFAKEDLPHLFERFYRGRNAKDNSVGIGLPLAKAIIEMQNGIISTLNLPNGGACFEIRFYSH